jgi:hypothetical protein
MTSMSTSRKHRRNCVNSVGKVGAVMNLAQGFKEHSVNVTKH